MCRPHWDTVTSRLDLSAKTRILWALLGCAVLALLVAALLDATGNEWWRHHKVTLHWNASTSPNVEGYHIYRRELPDGKYSRIDVGLMVRELSYVDEHVKSGKKYSYIVRAIARGQESKDSEPVEVDVP